MYKSIYAVLAVLAVLAVVSGNRFADAAPAAPVSPQIVAKAKLTGQTSAIPTTTIFTPEQTGLYRLSVYATLTRTDPSSQSIWNLDVGFTDDAGTFSLNSVLYANGDSFGPFQYEGIVILGGTVLPLEAKAGTPITYSVVQSGGPDNSAYSLYYTLERLE